MGLKYRGSSSPPPHLVIRDFVVSNKSRGESDLGGPESNRWGAYYKRRMTVEDCWMLPTSKLKDCFSELPAAPPAGYCLAVKIANGKLKRIYYWVDPCGSDDGQPLLKLVYNPSDSLSPRAELSVELTYTHPNYGGLRWWFKCPLFRKTGGVCGRRVAKLWLPPGQRYFGCSECHGLTYKSSLECHDFDGLFSVMGDGGVDEKAAEIGRAALKDLILQKKIAARKRRENTKSLMESFDEYFGEK